MTPAILKKRAESKHIPGFKRVKSRKLCYYCDNLIYNFTDGFVCKKHGLIFGDGEEAVSLMAEFYCDDFKPDTYK